MRYLKSVCVLFSPFHKAALEIGEPTYLAQVNWQLLWKLVYEALSDQKPIGENLKSYHILQYHSSVTQTGKFWGKKKVIIKK